MRPEELAYIRKAFADLVQGRCDLLSISITELANRAEVAEAKLREIDGLSLPEFRSVRDILWPKTPLYELYSLLLPPHETPDQLSPELRQLCIALFRLDGAYPTFLVRIDGEE